MSSVAVRTSGSITWDDFDDAIEGFAISVESRVKKGEEVLYEWSNAVEQLYQLDGHGGQNGDVSFDKSVGTIPLYSGDDPELEACQAMDDGESNSVRIEVRYTIELQDDTGESASPSEEAHIEGTTSFTATAKNRAASASASAHGEGVMDS